YQADLLARVAGQVKYVAKDIGEAVVHGELLVEIDVPDLDQEVAQKEAVLEQRIQEVKLAQTEAHIAEAAVENAQIAIKQREALVRQAFATVKLRRAEMERYRLLVERMAGTPDILDERVREYEVAEAAWDSSKVAVEKAKADEKEAKAKYEAALASVKLKRKLVEVAEKDLARAHAMADLAKIRAPFDGVIVERRIDPGSFVQSAASAVIPAYLAVARADLVTVSMKLPDNYADFVSTDTVAVIQLDQRPGELIQGRVTRFTPAIMGRDRIVRVEVDLYNGTEETYHQLVARCVAGFLAPLAATRTQTAVALAPLPQALWGREMKGNVAIP